MLSLVLKNTKKAKKKKERKRREQEASDTFSGLGTNYKYKCGKYSHLPKYIRKKCHNF